MIIGIVDTHSTDRVSEWASGFCQIASHTNSAEHAAHCVQCRDLAAILPKLKRPGYVKLIGAEVEQSAISVADLRMSKEERKRKAKADYKASVRSEKAVKSTRATASRVALLLSGAFVRTRHPNTN